MYVLYWSEWSTSRPGCFIPKKGTRHPLHRTLGKGGPSAGVVAYDTHSEADNTTENAELHKYLGDCILRKMYAITTNWTGILEICIEACLFSTRLPVNADFTSTFRSLTPFHQGTHGKIHGVTVYFFLTEKHYVRKKYTEVTNNWVYDGSSMLTSLPSVDLKNLRAPFAVTQCVQNQKAFKTNCKVRISPRNVLRM